MAYKKLRTALRTNLKRRANLVRKSPRDLRDLTTSDLTALGGNISIGTGLGVMVGDAELLDLLVKEIQRLGKRVDALEKRVQSLA